MTTDSVLAEPEGARMRRCVARRAPEPAARMIRFVVGPDHMLVPDLGGRLPGRGFWLSAERGLVDQAVRKRLFAKAARGQVETGPDLADRIEALLARRCLDLLGLARRAGSLVAGFDQVEDWLRAGKAALVLVASDAAQDGRRKIMALASGLQVVAAFSRAELGGAVGRDETVHMALARGGIAGRLRAELARLQGFRAFALPDGAAEPVMEREEGISRT